VRKQIRMNFSRNGKTHSIDVLIYLPPKGTASRPVPAFLGLNISGNHTTQADPGIRITDQWLPNRFDGVVNNRATEASRGTKTSRWPAEELVAQGDALVTAYCGDIDPDLHDGFTNGVHALYAPPKANE